MTGVILLIVISVGVVTLIAIVNLAIAAREDHEAAGLYGRDLRHQHLASQTLADELTDGELRAELRCLAAVVAALDRVAFHGVPLERCAPQSGVAPGDVWSLSFRDGTVVVVRAIDRRAMERATTMAAREPVVVGRVHPFGDTALVELTSPRHRSLRVAVRA
jgi:hypothetical protein